MRVDGKVAVVLLSPAIALGMLTAISDKFRRLTTNVRDGVSCLYLLLLPVASMGMIGYYQEFNDAFNAFAFQILHDDFTGILLTMIREYSLLPNLAFSALLSVILMTAYWKIVRPEAALTVRQRDVLNRPNLQVVVTLVSVALIVIAARGGLLKKSISPLNLVVSPYRVFNKSVLNPLYALRIGFAEYSKRNDYNDLLSVYSESEAISALSTKITTPTSQRIDIPKLELNQAAFQRIATGTSRKPQHVFFLFLESYDAWPFLKKYESLGIVDYGKRLANNGLLIRRFLPAANNSVPSYIATVSGLHETNHFDQKCLPTSIVFNMKQLGYRAISVGGFPPTWQRFDEHCTEQGFDEIYSTREIMPNGETPNGQIHDRTLFEFIRNKVSFDAPTFSFIRSSSYHSPYQVDLKNEDCELESMPENLKPICDGDPEQLRLRLGHLKYTDRMMGQFIEEMESRYPDSLFVITGDHYCRHFLNHTPGVYERSSVPLILYGSKVLAGRMLPENATGSHVDIATTLVELCAPAGFNYHGVGRDLLKEYAEPLAVGTDFVILGNYIVDIKPPGEVAPLPGCAAEPHILSSELIARAMSLHQSHHSLGFHLARNYSKQNEPQRNSGNPKSVRRN